MANDINVVTLVGRLTREIDLKTTNGGGLIANFSLASNRSEKRGDSWMEAAGFYPCVLFGKRAEVLQKHTKKGSRLCVSGSLKWSSWEGSDGKKNSKIEINVTDLQFLDAKQDGGRDAKEESQFNSGSIEDAPF